MTVPTDPRSSAPTPEVPLRPSPPLPKRLNRNVLTVAAALAGVTVLTVLVVANPSRRRETPAVGAIDGAPPAPAQPTFLNVPPRQPPAAANGPSATPAERGHLVGRPAPINDAPSPREMAYQTALTSHVLVRDAASNSLRPVDEVVPLGAEMLHVNSDASAPRAAAADAPYALRAGTVIAGLLMTGINSDLPGEVVGQTSRNVFDSRTQQILLIPRGSKLIGTYDNRSVRSGRLIVEWIRLLFPDGRSITLPRPSATDESGESGLHDHVNHHYGRMFGTALLLSTFTAGVQLSQPEQAMLYGPASSGQVAAGALGQQLGELGIESARRGLDIPPTITIRAGQPFDVLLTQDIAFDGPFVPEI